ncbi:MAG: hypothetical protein DRN16_02210 [Thermoplasmata archaeon]|nr:MAG: hypothetical protein DRN16_02210 [Thermoplasmata archaeon]
MVEGGGDDILEEIIKTRKLVSLLYLFSGVAILFVSIIVYYYRLPFTGSGWSVKNHKYWYLFLLSWVFSIIMLSIGLMSIIKTRFKRKTHEIPVFSTIQKMKLKCKKCGHIFEILSPRLDKEYKCPRCGEVGTIGR